MTISSTPFSSISSTLGSSEGLIANRITQQNSNTSAGALFQIPQSIEFQSNTPSSTPLQALGIQEPKTFGHLMQQVVRDVNQVQQVSGEKVRDVLQGGKTSIHDAMIAVEESGVAFTMLTEMRNKLLESYQEVMRIPV